MYIPQLNKMEHVSRSPRPKSLDDRVHFYGLEAARKPGRTKTVGFLTSVVAIVVPLGIILLG